MQCNEQQQQTSQMSPPPGMLTPQSTPMQIPSPAYHTRTESTSPSVYNYLEMNFLTENLLECTLLNKTNDLCITVGWWR